MAKKNARPTSAEQVAQKAKPNWKPVTAVPAQDTYEDAPSSADAQTPELEALQRKYFGVSSDETVKSAKSAKSAAAKKSKMVVMEPKNPTDTRTGRKTVIVEDGKVIGEQG